LPVQACRLDFWEQNGNLRPRRDVVDLWSEVIDAMLPRKAADCDDKLLIVPQTDTGGWVENTKALGKTLVKELGKLTP
jgi:hypothetical protein